MAIEAGVSAPDFTLASQDNEPVTLSGLRGNPVVLVFHPLSFTGG
jgi:peroxiredoxin